MKINYYQSCFNETLTADDIKLAKDTKELTDKIAEELFMSCDKLEFIKNYLFSEGEYVDHDQCEQCGDTDLEIILEVNVK